MTGGLQKECLHEFALRFEDLGVTKDKIARAMGYNSADTGPVFDHCYEQIIGEMPLHCDIKSGYRLFPRESVAIRKDGFDCNGLFFNTGALIAYKLTDAGEMAFFLVTAGIGIDAWSKSAFAAGDFLEGYMIDTFGSEIAEAAADAVEAKIGEHAAAMAQSITNRYSPGYCGWDVGEQQKLFSLLPEKFCEITLTESSLMVPIKSVSGVVGIGKKATKKDYQCSICEMTHCIRREKT